MQKNNQQRWHYVTLANLNTKFIKRRQTQLTNIWRNYNVQNNLQIALTVITILVIAKTERTHNQHKKSQTNQQKNIANHQKKSTIDN